MNRSFDINNLLLGGGWPMSIPKGVNNKIRINDTRKISPTSGKPLRDIDRKSLDVNREDVSSIVENAKKAGIDPLTALAISYQETGFNQEGRGLYNLNPQIFGKPVGNAEEGMKSLQEQFRIARDLQKRGVIPNTEDYYIQGNNGYGTIKRGHSDLEGAHKIYGLDIPEQGINMKSNPLYGKTVLSLRDLLKLNPDIMNMINESSNKKAIITVKK